MPADTLIAAIRSGNETAFVELVRRHRSGVSAYFRARLLDHSQAHKLTRLVFVRFLQTIDHFPESAQIADSLRGIAANLLYEHIRGSQSKRQRAWAELCLELDADPQAAQTAREPSENDALGACLASLGPTSRQALELRYGADLGPAEIAAQMKRSEQASRALLSAARAELQEALAARRHNSP